jgi:dolichol-phosphate mannosyltransferase
MKTRENHPTMSFVVTALNEAANIRATVDQILETTRKWGAPFEILLINDGSTDDTGPIMEELAAQNKNIKVFHNEHNLGLGGAYKRGAAAAQGTYIMLVPGDNAWPSESLDQIIAAVGQADIVIPYQVNSQARPLMRRVGSWGFTVCINTLFKLPIKYYNGLVVHRTELLREISINTNGFAYQAEALLKLLKRGHSYVEVGTMVTERQGGRSKALRPKNLLSVLQTICYLYQEIGRNS